MITSKKELEFYLKADRMMNRGVFTLSIKQRAYRWVFPDLIMEYLGCMRRFDYWQNFTPPNMFYKLAKIIMEQVYKRHYQQLGRKLGFSIGESCCGYGLVLHHYGTIVIGSNCRIGNYANIQTSTCIVKRGSRIGNSFFMAAGAKVTKEVTIGDNVCVGANSVVNISFPDGNMMVAGTPARAIKTVTAWYESVYSPEWGMRHDAVEKMRMDMGL